MYYLQLLRHWIHFLNFLRGLDNGHSIWILALWTSLNVQKIVTLRIYSARTLLTIKVATQTLQPPPKSSVQRNGTVTPLKAVNQLWLNEKQVDLLLQQLK